MIRKQLTLSKIPARASALARNLCCRQILGMSEAAAAAGVSGRSVAFCVRVLTRQLPPRVSALDVGVFVVGSAAELGVWDVDRAGASAMGSRSEYYVGSMLLMLWLCGAAVTHSRARVREALG